MVDAVHAQLTALGWNDYFDEQLRQSDRALAAALLANGSDINAETESAHRFETKGQSTNDQQLSRVVGVERTGLQIAPGLTSGVDRVPVAGRWFLGAEESRPTIGDWVICRKDNGAEIQILPRKSLIKRLSPAGTVQLIAANVDVAFIVTSCNSDFSAARLERYLSVVMEAGIDPVLVLTKADLSTDQKTYADELARQFPNIAAHLLNALDANSVGALLPWCGSGQTIALLGSSGVGKSTLVNTLLGRQVQPTQAVRDEDDKGRHTTTSRSLHKLPSGGVILDSPGMRELQIAAAEEGLEQLFADIEELASLCKFNDCAHKQEPGCRVQAAIENGQLDPHRLARFQNLRLEDQTNRASVAQRHERDAQGNKSTSKSAGKLRHKGKPQRPGND